MPIYTYKKSYYLVIVLAACMLLLPAFINGFPLVNSDTASYITSGFKPETPFDRPITYGLLMRLFSLNGMSLWLVIFLQAYLTAWLLALVTRTLLGQKAVYCYPIIIIVLATCTSLSWVCSELIADLYTPVIFLCVFLLLYGAERKNNRILLYVILTTAVATHISHLLITVALLICTFFVIPYLVLKENLPKARRTLLAMLLVSMATISVMGAALSKSKHIFLMGSMLEKGVLAQYLGDNCDTKNYAICRYPLPTDANQFLWEEDSPLYKAGGWKETKEEYNTIINDILTTPRYLGAFISQSLLATSRQFINCGVGDGNTPFVAGSNVSSDISTYLPQHSEAFLEARQNRGTLHPYLTPFNLFINIVLVFSVLIIVLVLWQNRHARGALPLFILICSLGIIINIADCAFFAQVNGRYGCRVMWLLPFIAMLTLCYPRAKSNRII